MSLAGSTPLHTLSGTFTIDAVVARGLPVYGLTWDGKQITVGQCRLESVGVCPLMRVLLDNGRSFSATEDHLVVERETFERVSFKTVGLSVMPLYLGRTTLGYPTFRQQGDLWKSALAPSDRRRDRLVSRMVYEWKSKRPIETGLIVRHVDRDRTNSMPENLRIEGTPKKGRVRGTLKSLIQAHKVIEQGFKPGRNHKIVGWEPTDEEEAFDLVSDQCSNLAVGEVFVAVNNGPA